MSFDLLILDGYGQFVWPAFIFTFACCFSLYLKTKKELVKQEKKFLIKFKQLPVVKIEAVKHIETSKKVLTRSLSL